MKRLFLMLLATVSLIACNKGGDDTPKPIELTGGTQTTQTVYADETQKSDGIKFNATAPWVATVSGVAMRSGSDVEWLTLNAYEGKAGEQTLTLTLLPNTTGLDRKAEIKISCGGVTITITVEQKGVTQSGEKPEPTSVYITAAGKITGGEILGKNTPVTLQWAMRSTNGDQEVLSPTSFPYVNKNFDITLPIPTANLLGAITNHSGLSITPSSAKFTSAVLCDQDATKLELTNIAPHNVNSDSYLFKKGEGYVLFMYATTVSTVSGMFTDELYTFKFNNCQFRQGWNEVMAIAEENASVNGSVTYGVTANNATSDFKWVAQSGEKPEPTDSVRLVSKISREFSSSGITTFSYDANNRIVAANYTYDNLPETQFRDKSTWEYNESTIVYKNDFMEINSNSKVYSEIETATITLNTDKTVKNIESKTISRYYSDKLNKEVSDITESIDEMTYTNRYLTRVYSKIDEKDESGYIRYTSEDISLYKWNEKGNMMKMYYEGDSIENFHQDYEYLTTPYDKKCNIDISAYLSMDLNRINLNIGKRNSSLCSKLTDTYTITYSGPNGSGYSKEVKDVYNYAYQYDTRGYVTKITITKEDSGDNKSVKSAISTTRRGSSQQNTRGGNGSTETTYTIEYKN